MLGRHPRGHRWPSGAVANGVRIVSEQFSLDRIEAENFADFSALQSDQIVGPIDNDLLYAVQYPSTRGPFPEVGFGGSGGGYEADEGLFYGYANNEANDAISSPSSSLDLSASSLAQQLAARPLDANLNYIQQFLTSTLNVNMVGVGILFQSCNQNTMTELALSGSPLDTAAAQLSGAKALLSAVLELGMPYTLVHDGVLHGFLYGNESLVDNAAATTFLQNQNAQLQASPNAVTPALTAVGSLRYLRFQDRLNQDLINLQAKGQPEIPRLVGQTLRLLNLLSDAWTPPANSPPPVLEISSTSHTPSLLLYGEPNMNYTLQYQDSLGGPAWTTTTRTNLQDEETIIPPLSGGPQRFYRLMLPTP